MFAVNRLYQAAPVIARNALQQRNMSVVSTPARNKVSGGEQIFLSMVMVGSWLAIPAWVLVNMKHYRPE